MISLSNRLITLTEGKNEKKKSPQIKRFAYPDEHNEKITMNFTKHFTLYCNFLLSTPLLFCIWNMENVQVFAINQTMSMAVRFPSFVHNTID